MKRSFEQYHREIINGGGPFRALLRAAEPIYGAVVSARNALFDHAILGSQRAARPVVCVGNITTGGTGKTPVVQWLAQRLLTSGHHPAILFRGYKGGDESQMLREKLPGLTIQVNPSRTEGAKQVLQSHPQTTVFVLDDGFQHRKLQRDFDLVLIDESNPFGFNHVLPRGLLREPLTGLSRAHAFLLTHVEEAEDFAIEPMLRRHNKSAPIYRCRHVQTGLRDRGGATMPLSQLVGRKVMTFCGIGNPKSFSRQILAAGAIEVASHWFGDHHNYSTQDVETLQNRARAAGAEMLITTEKDWVKLQALADSQLPIWRTELSIQFLGDDEARLFAQISDSIKKGN